MSNYIKKVARKNKKASKKEQVSNVQDAICNYIDYFVSKGAKEFKIDFIGNDFLFWTDAGLSEEELQSEEHKKLCNEMYFALTGRTDCFL